MDPKIMKFIKSLIISSTFSDRNINDGAGINIGKLGIRATAVTSDYTVLITDSVLLVDCSGGNINISVPPVLQNKPLLIIRVDVSIANVLTLVPSGSDIFVTEGTVPAFTWACIFPDGVDLWYTLAGVLTIGSGSDPFPAYFILNGRAGSQTGNGGTMNGENLILSSTSGSIKGKIGLAGDVVKIYIDDVNKKLNVGAPRTTTARLNVETSDPATVGMTVRATTGPGVVSATGGVITDVGGYRVHTFTSGGNFVVPTGGPSTVYPTLVAGGGGAGGTASGQSGGGGAGGVIQPTGTSITPGTYPVIVGAGGAGGNNTNSNGTNGSDSTFNGLDAIGGGGGAINGGPPPPANNGGSGGGGGNNGGSGGTGVVGQGHDGGMGGGGGTSASAGGGGASTAGGNGGPGTVGGNGGNGVTISSFGQSGTYGGGGGGSAPTPGSGGTGGGGAGTSGGGGNDGTANTGGGGGGASVGNSGAGGSGIVVISYVYPTGAPQSADLIEALDDSGNPLSTVDANGNITTQQAGVGFKVKEGSNACMGKATLSGGTIVVNTTKVTANSRIFLTVEGGILTNVGTPYVSARTPGTSFTITSTNALDASDVGWLIMEPS